MSSDGVPRTRTSSSLASASTASAALTPSTTSSHSRHSGIPDAAYPGMPRSLEGIAVRAFCLGAALVASAVGTVYLLYTGNALWRLPFFWAALAAFHFLEFWTTARYNTPAATVDSFLLTANWPAYAVAHAAASVEVAVRLGVLQWQLPGPITAAVTTLGLVAVAIGQAVRSAAMIHAGRSFNHTIQRSRADSHTLVTTGVYGWSRHPSYFGFFWWALGTQLVLGNTVCLAAYGAVLWRFFAARIRHEEVLLVRFFGADYEAYRARVGTKIPFV